MRAFLLALTLTLALAFGGIGPIADALVPAARAQEGAAAAPLVEQPARAFGHVLGDVLVQRVRLADARGEIALASLPQPGRVGPWFERLPPAVTAGEGGRGWLELRYQLVDSPTELRVVELPPVALAGTGAVDGGARALSVAPWPVSIGPLAPSPPPGTAGLPAMRPDRLLPPHDTGAIVDRARLAGLGLAATLAAWLGWWLLRRRRDAARLPFAHAWQAIRATDAAERDEDPRVWTALHAALNRAAGQLVGAGSLDALLARHPWLAPWRTRLEAFFAASAARFFETPPRAVPFAVEALARELYRAERRHAR